MCEKLENAKKSKSGRQICGLRFFTQTDSKFFDFCFNNIIIKKKKKKWKISSSLKKHSKSTWAWAQRL